MSLLTFSNLKIGILTALLAQPFEVIRTSSIINQHKINNLSFQGMFAIMRLIKDSEGMRGFFRGGSLSILKTTFGYCFFFTGLESLNHISSKSQNIRTTFSIPDKFVDFINALLSKTATAWIMSPINVLKTRFEVVGNHEYSSIPHAIRKIYQTEGLRGFYRGVLATILRDGPYSGIQYSLYKTLLDMGKVRENQGKEHRKYYVAAAAGISGAIAIMLTYPFDNIRVRYQFEKGERRSFLKFCREIHEKEGFSGFYKGYLPRLLKKIASSALSWSLYEHIKRGNREMS